MWPMMYQVSHQLLLSGNSFLLSKYTRFVIGFLLVLVFVFLTVLEKETLPEEKGREGFSYSVGSSSALMFIAKRDGEAVLDFVRRANKRVFQSVYHCENLAPEKYWLNNIYNSLSGRDKQGTLAVGLISCGLCHQSAYILARILLDNDIEASVLGISGHVIVKFSHFGQIFYIDPDYGVGPFDSESPLLSERLLQVYGGVTSENNTLGIVSMYMTQAGHGSYYTMKYLDQRAESQVLLYRLQLFIKYTLLSLGGFFVISGGGRIWR